MQYTSIYNNIVRGFIYSQPINQPIKYIDIENENTLMRAAIRLVNMLNCFSAWLDGKRWIDNYLHEPHMGYCLILVHRQAHLYIVCLFVCLRHFQQYYSYIVAASFIGRGILARYIGDDFFSAESSLIQSNCRSLRNLKR